LPIGRWQEEALKLQQLGLLDMATNTKWNFVSVQINMDKRLSARYSTPKN